MKISQNILFVIVGIIILLHALIPHFHPGKSQIAFNYSDSIQKNRIFETIRHTFSMDSFQNVSDFVPIKPYSVAPKLLVQPYFNAIWLKYQEEKFHELSSILSDFTPLIKGICSHHKIHSWRGPPAKQGHIV